MLAAKLDLKELDKKLPASKSICLLMCQLWDQTIQWRQIQQHHREQ